MIDEKTPQFNPDTSVVDEGSFVSEFGEPSFELGTRVREAYERPVYLSLAFWAGNQGIDIVRDNREIFASRKITENSHEVRRIDNQIPIHVRQICSTCGENMPDLEAIPGSYMDERLVQNASMGSRVLKWRDRVDKERALRMNEVMWMLAAGEVLRKTYFDSKAGRKISGVYEGDIKSEVINFFRYVKDPQTLDQWPPRWLIEYDAKNVDWVKAQYGVMLEPENVADRMKYVDRLAMNTMQGRQQSREALLNSVVLKRMYVPPSEKYPGGHCWIWAAGKLLKHHNLQVGRYPFEKAEWFHIPGRIYPLGLIELLLSDQRHLNTLLSMMHEVIVRQLRGDIISAGRNQEAEVKIINKRTGQQQVMLPPGIEKFELMRYDQNWQLGELSMEQVRNNLKEKSGQNKPSLGQEVSGQKTLGELQIAREADFANLAWTVNNYVEDSVCPVAEQKLALMAKYVKNFREAVIPGDKKGPEYFTGSDLEGIDGVMAIPVPKLTPAMKRQAIAEAHQGGLTGPYPLGLQQQLACRTLLRMRGLAELEEEVAQTYGPIEELEAKCKELAQADEMIEFEAKKTAMMELKAKQKAIVQSMMTPVSPVDPATGQPVQAPQPAMMQ